VSPLLRSISPFCAPNCRLLNTAFLSPSQETGWLQAISGGWLN
jgi:hypothetical protein